MLIWRTDFKELELQRTGRTQYIWTVGSWFYWQEIRTKTIKNLYNWAPNQFWLIMLIISIWYDSLNIENEIKKSHWGGTMIIKWICLAWSQLSFRKLKKNNMNSAECILHSDCSLHSCCLIYYKPYTFSSLNRSIRRKGQTLIESLWFTIRFQSFKYQCEKKYFDRFCLS